MVIGKVVDKERGGGMRGSKKRIKGREERWRK